MLYIKENYLEIWQVNFKDVKFYLFYFTLLLIYN